MIEVIVRPKKRLFLSLILASLLLAAVSTYGLWMVSFPGLSNISIHLPVILGGLLTLLLLAVALGIGGIVLAILGFSHMTLFQGAAWWAINLLFPMAIQIGKCFDVEKERVERSFIEVSNHLITTRKIRIKPEQLLILTPHCIQEETCPYKVTHDSNNCRQCGRCQVGDLLNISRKYNVPLAIVTGGTLARKVIKTLRPRAVLAIACERDLTSGIQDMFPLPVIGVLNERPNGPCCNTRIDPERVEAAVRNFIV